MSLRISITNVNYSDKNEKRISDVSCSLSAGITYVIGSNGGGKSTLLKLIATAIKPSTGSITYTRLMKEADVGTYRKQLSIEEVRKTIGFMPQRFTGYSDMSIERYLTYMALHKGIPRNHMKHMVEEWLNRSGLYELKRKKLGTLSGGQLQKIGLIQALLNQPLLCILDEPYEGLDNREKQYFRRAIQKLSFHSIVIISTHLIEEIEQSDQDRLLHIEDGQLCYYGGVDRIDNIMVTIQKEQEEKQ